MFSFTDPDGLMHARMHVSLLCVTCSLRSVMAKEPLYLVVNIMLYAPEQDVAIQFFFLVKPKARPGDCGIP